VASGTNTCPFETHSEIGADPGMLMQYSGQGHSLEGFRFFFYSDEGDPRAPAHIHVFKAGSEAKFWMRPDVQLAQNDGFDAKTLRKITAMTIRHRDQLESAWHDYFA